MRQAYEQPRISLGFQEDLDFVIVIVQCWGLTSDGWDSGKIQLCPACTNIKRSPDVLPLYIRGSCRTPSQFTIHSSSVSLARIQKNTRDSHPGEPLLHKTIQRATCDAHQQCKIATSHLACLRNTDRHRHCWNPDMLMYVWTLETELLIWGVRLLSWILRAIQSSWLGASNPQWAR